MIAAGVAILIGALLLGAVTHVTVLATGGYGTPHSYLTIAIAVGVGAGSVYTGKAWADRRYGVAIGLFLAIVAGEVFGLYQTANRLVAGSEHSQAPLREYAKRHQEATDAVKAAEKSLASASTSRRLEEAIAAKKRASEESTAKAAEMGCRKGCIETFDKRVAEASAEVVAAREEIRDAKATAEAKVKSAKATLVSMKAPESPTPLADRLGVAPWLLDLVASIFGSYGANGLACFLLMYGAHGSHWQNSLEQHANGRAHVPEAVAAPKKVDPPRQPKMSRRDHAAKFALSRLAPDGGGVDLDAIRQEYRTWARGEPMRLTDAEIGAELARLFEEAGIEIAQQGERLVAIGVALKGRELARLN